jgi:preprotein translocase subunit YajC
MGAGAQAANMEGDHVLLAQEGSGGSGILTFLPIILLIAAMYFLMIRPQSRRRREAQEMQSRLGVGDEVQTVGGLFATVTAVDDDAITLEPSPGIQMRYARGAIARVTNRSASGVDEAEAGSHTSDASKTIEQG